MKINLKNNTKIFNSIKNYLVHLQFARRLSINTVKAYSFDLIKYAEFLSSKYNLKKPEQIQLSNIKEFIKKLHRTSNKRNDNTGENKNKYYCNSHNNGRF